MERMFDKANFAAGAGVPALDWSGIDIVEAVAPRDRKGWTRMPLAILSILASGFLTQGYLSQCL